MAAVRLMAAVMLMVPFLSLVGANGDAKRLYDDLMNGYNSVIRPVGNNSGKELFPRLRAARN